MTTTAIRWCYVISIADSDRNRDRRDGDVSLNCCDVLSVTDQTDLRTQIHRRGVVVSTLVAVVALLGGVMTCAGVVQFVLCLQILFALMCGGFIWAVLNDRIPAKTGKGACFLTLEWNIT